MTRLSSLYYQDLYEIRQTINDDEIFDPFLGQVTFVANYDDEESITTRISFEDLSFLFEAYAMYKYGLLNGPEPGGESEYIVG